MFSLKQLFSNPKQLFLSAIIMLLLDGIYLSSFSAFFNKVVHQVQGKNIQMNMVGVIFCYIFLIIGLNYFIISQRKSLTDAFILGLVVYGVYETTTYALFEKWSPAAVLLDTSWGAILFTLTTYFTYKFL